MYKTNFSFLYNEVSNYFFNLTKSNFNFYICTYFGYKAFFIYVAL